LKNALIALAATATLLAGCATPTVVATQQPQDHTLNCQQLRMAYAEADKFEQDARAERGVTGKNVAATLLFWPALVGTYMNTDDAIKAARDRKQHLSQLQMQKRCG
jgi:hypothetical protein